MGQKFWRVIKSENEAWPPTEAASVAPAKLKSAKPENVLPAEPWQLLCRHRPMGQPEKEQSCHVEPFFRSLHPLSWVSGLLGLFQLTPPPIIEEVLASIAEAFTGVAITGAYAREWR
jgi:hypothetical protein